MPRIVRGLGDDIVYHVINRGNGRQEVFHKEQDHEAFMRLLKEAKERYQVALIW
jgi:putative transposase